ncbi:MAG: AzlD family protein [Alphaproteobacteria bacterium]|nr:AzlD family protein [Alphaproteobacteria bacterium]
MDLISDIPAIYWIILAGAAATYATRFGGYLVVSRFENIPPRINAALDAVPAAVLTTLVAPALLSLGWAEAVTLCLAGVVALRFSLSVTLVAGGAAIILLRALSG